MAVNIICGDALEALRNMPSESVNCCVTSPPYYGLRDYGTDGQVFRAEDTGVHGNVIDVYIESHEQALAMGVYKTEVCWR